MERLAQAIKLAAKYREESWVPSPSTDGETPQGKYAVTLMEAADKAAEEVGLDERGTIPVYLLLARCWNDTLNWAKSYQSNPEGTVILGINIGNNTVAEYLLDQYNQKVLLDTIVDKLRKRGEWGRRGLFNKISSVTQITSAHIGQVLTGKKNITETFLLKLIAYFEG